jgi:hypothetical protein
MTWPIANEIEGVEPWASDCEDSLQLGKGTKEALIREDRRTILNIAYPQDLLAAGAELVAHTLLPFSAYG